MHIFAPALALLLLSTAATAQSYDYRTLHLIEDRHTHAVIRVTPAPEAELPERGRANCNDVEGLNRRGRNTALAFGRMFQRSGIHIDEILVSRLCRTIEAGKLLSIGPVREFEALDPPAADELPDARLDAILGRIDSLRPSETVLLIAHHEIVEALTGESLEPGEGLVFRLPPFGEIEVRARFGLPPL
ncbi:MAG: hypothetical protein AAGI34_00500 [Pseudomonadota bacterium]